ncbi:MAG: class I SAM-dependent methyltransferase [Bacilli bacterium]
MARWNLDYYRGENSYTDGEIEKELLMMVKSGEKLDEIIKKDNRWPILYHLSPLRQNILNWYNFKKDTDLLEIGAGCGALTELFCNKVKGVTSIELTKIRSEINFERNKKYENLEIISGNFHNIKFDKKFDYIILNGVFEYAASFTDTKTPYIDFLNEIKGLLAPHGKILIAIENRLGLKYFNGAPEDHTGELFSGLNDYKDIDFVKTFTKNDLEKLAFEGNFKGIKFYYPVFDYKFPELIFTSEYFKIMNFVTPQKTYSADRLNFFNENEVMRALVNEGVFDHFSNSFLIELSKEEIENKKLEILYAKISNYRKKQFSIITKIIKENDEIFVTKEGMNAKSISHIKNMIENQKYSNISMKNAKVEEFENGIRMEFIEENTFEYFLLTLLKEEKKKLFEKQIKQFYQLLLQDSIVTSEYYSDEFKKVFGNREINTVFHCKENMNIDMIFSNVFLKDDDYTVIDFEWMFHFQIPVEFIMWRCLLFFYLNNENVKKQYTFENLLTVVGISLNEVNEVFSSWDVYFVYDYVGSTDYKQYYKNMYQLEKEDVKNIMNKFWIKTVLYIDRGFGFNEKDIYTNRVQKNASKYYTVVYNVDISENRIVNIRWDPCEFACKICNLKLETQNDLEIIPLNKTFTKDGWEYFCTDDPVYIIKGDYENIESLKISFEIEALKQDDIFIKINKLAEENNKMNQLVESLEQSNKENIECSNGYKQEYETILNSHFWKLTAPMRKILDKRRK